VNPDIVEVTASIVKSENAIGPVVVPAAVAIE
jgi:hypothetical protein